MDYDEDLALQLHLQEEVLSKQQSCLDLPDEPPIKLMKTKHNKENEQPASKTSLIDPSWEYIDPTPNVHAMFLQFNTRFFWGELLTVEVKWSPRMTTCAGVCSYEGGGGLCSIRLSAPLLKLRPRKDLVETLLHEMIHAFLFITDNDRDRDGHGPEFHKHMYRINNEAGTNISVYHDFHDEVKLYQQHWWRCNGPCQKKRPYFGMVKRAMNRPPGPNDFWWSDHQSKCGGSFIKVREPERFKNVKVKGGDKKTNGESDIRKFFPFNGEGKVLATNKTNGSKNISSQNRGAVGAGNDSLPTSSSGSKMPVSSMNHNGNVHTVSNPQKIVSKSIDIYSNKPLTENGKASIRGTGTLGQFFEKSFTQTSSSKFSPVPNRNGFGQGGMLANRGGGTLVITKKGKKYQGETRANITGMKGLISSQPEQHAAFVGQGKVLVTSASTRKPAVEEKPWLTRLNKIESKSQIVKVDLLHNKNFSIAMNNSNIDSAKMQSTVDSIVDNEGIQLKLPADDLCVMVNCPTCDSLIKETDINLHLDSCIENFSNNSEKCPICNNDILLSEINSHVNSCIDGFENPKTAVKNKTVKCPMCNDELLDCDLSDHLEMCIQCVTEEQMHLTEEEENECDKGNEKINPCPICMELLEECEMNKHLDECLSKIMINEFQEISY